MSTFVLKREYALQLPNSYVEIDRDEMEYVDGGSDFTTHWWGYALNLYKDQCEELKHFLKTTRNVLTAVTLLGVKVPPLALASGLTGVYIQQLIDNLDHGISKGGATLSIIKAGQSYVPYINPW